MKAVVDQEKCRGCKCCQKRGCSLGAITVSGGKAFIGEKCVGCGQCIDLCPFQAIQLVEA